MGASRRRHQDLLDRLGETIRARRRELGWTRRALSTSTEISERFLADMEAGKANPSLLKLCDVAAALGTTAQGLLQTAHALLSEGAPCTLALLGLRGAGKSTIGRSLAERLGWDFVELDREVEADTGLDLAQLFELHGEPYYRRAERTTLRRLLHDAVGSSRILATGGGIVSEPETFDLLRAQTRTVWLRASPAEHWARVVSQGDTRPMADNEQAYAALCQIHADRERLYRRAELTVETSGREVGDVCDEVVERLRLSA